eukprot:10749351-Lingulodinium_polyedra.AAC.1
MEPDPVLPDWPPELPLVGALLEVLHVEVTAHKIIFLVRDRETSAAWVVAVRHGYQSRGPR